MAKKTENINSLISFSIKDKYVEIGDIKIFFYRFYPPNISILTDAELENEISSFGGFIEAAGIPIQIFAMDKVEDLSGNKAFFESLSDKYSEYTEKIVEQISSHDTTNGKTNSVQRAYYFVVRIKAEAENQTFVDALRNQNLKFATVERDELVTIFRNYFLREFSSFDLYTFDKDTNSEYAATKKKSIKKMGLEAYADFNLRQRLTPQRIDFLPRYILQNDFYRKVIMIKNFPSSISAPHILSSLSKIKSTTFSARLEQMSESKASTLINNQFNNQSSKRKSSKRVTEKIDAEIDEQNIEDFYRGLQESNNKIFLTNIFIEFYAEDEKSLNALERKIKNVLAGNKITYESLRFEQKEGFKSVNPLGKDETLHFNSELINDLLLMLRDAYDGSLGYILNGTTNISNSSIIDFDINSLLMGSKNRMQAVIFNIMTYVWNRIAQRKDKILFAVDELSFTVTEEDLTSISLKGYYNRADDTIHLSNKLNDSARLEVMCHELAHGVLHKTSTQPTEIKEFEAECFAAMLKRKMGYPVSEESKRYISSYYKKAIAKNPKFECNATLDRLSKAFKHISTGIDETIAQAGYGLDREQSINLQQAQSKAVDVSNISQNFMQAL